MGYCLDTADENTLDDCEWILFQNMDSAFPYRGFKGSIKKILHRIKKKKLYRDLYQECLAHELRDRTGLFLIEGPVVSPKNWNKTLHDLFPVILTWKDDIVDNERYFKLQMAYQMLEYPSIPQVPFNQKKLLINISMNKSSRHPQELYSERRKSIRYFEKTHPDDFDLFGVGWDQPRNMMGKMFPFLYHQYTSYRGVVKNKWDILPFYRFCLCYENISNESGYISEKIFDAMRCGCVPIYLGAPNITDYVDTDTFIDRRQFKTDKDLSDFLFDMTEKDYIQYQTAIRGYLSSAKFAKFLPPAYADTIIDVLGLASG